MSTVEPRGRVVPGPRAHFTPAGTGSKAQPRNESIQVPAGFLYTPECCVSHEAEVQQDVPP